MKKKIVIFGSGGHSKVVFSEIIKLKKYIILGFIDDLQHKRKKIITFRNKTYYNLGKIEDLIKSNKDKKKSKNNFYGIIGIGSNNIRNKIVNKVSKIDKLFKWESIISKDCILNGDVKIDEGSLVLSGVIINTQSKIGKHCIINTSSSIDHDNHFKNFSSCGPGVITGGNISIGEKSHLGIGSVVKNGIKIGKNTIIGGNSFVNKGCPDNSLYYGVPIKKIKR